MDITVSRENGGSVPLFSRLTVEKVMRRRALRLRVDRTIAEAVRTLVKHKADAVLIVDEQEKPVGVVSRTEIMGAYYADMPIETLLGDIMGSPVIGCAPGDTLESALTTMQQAAIHRLYVTEPGSTSIGSLSYFDIVGALYRYCCRCEYGLRRKTEASRDTRLRYQVKEAMTPEIQSAPVTASIEEVIASLSSFRLGALLITDAADRPAGVVSKADLALAYRRGVDLDEPAEKIMHSPPQLCHEAESLEEAIRRMILGEISRLFIHCDDRQQVVGVLSLSDAARMRSGSCQACSTSRIRVKE